MTQLPDTTTEAWQHEASVMLARRLCLAVVQQQYNLGNLSLDEARELLSGELTPGDPGTVYNDADQLEIKETTC